VVSSYVLAPMDSYMKTGGGDGKGYCAQTCGRCTPQDLTDDYNDYNDVEVGSLSCIEFKYPTYLRECHKQMHT